LDGVVLYRQRLPIGKFLLWALLAFAAVLVLFAIGVPVAGFLQRTLFNWVPEWFLLNSGIDGGYSWQALLILNLASIPVFLVGIPVAEELYFRGYLLPRLAHLGLWAVVINCLLFALYHFTTPWMIISRTLFALPLAYVAYKKQNLGVPILLHVLANSVDVIAGFLNIFSGG
jgi:uncharacterized protein